MVVPPALSPQLAFFGHDANEPALRRRIEALGAAGACVTGYTMRRGASAPVTWRDVDLGETRDHDYGQRVAAMIAALPTLWRHRRRLRQADLFYARNLDMLALAVAGRTLSRSRARIIYECLDIHRLMTREDLIGGAMRALERALLGQTKLLVVSAPAFLREYFERRHPGRFTGFLVENRMPAGRDYGRRPQRGVPQVSGRPLTIGWFGNLRCRRSLELLRALAARFPETVRVVLRGYPARAERAN